MRNYEQYKWYTSNSTDVNISEVGDDIIIVKGLDNYTLHGGYITVCTQVTFHLALY